MKQSVSTISRSDPYDPKSINLAGTIHDIPYTFFIIASALVSMFCFPLIGVPGIFVSLEVKKRVEMGDFNGAKRWAIAAKFCIGAALVFGIVAYILIFVLGFR
ncbi:hypothetical protein HOLleu_02793 [Holothuria leucospilota]|uniref:CD225/dispanin family protein n=1 Tax=Holothuria leucospilota TaxID=206669 RepID=A0A9Q1CQU7_HOLLE|nr:hypothetical protein HOLleu_02793 [Holothuria leucospilota]